MDSIPQWLLRKFVSDGFEVMTCRRWQAIIKGNWRSEIRPHTEFEIGPRFERANGSHSPNQTRGAFTISGDWCAY